MADSIVPAASLTVWLAQRAAKFVGRNANGAGVYKSNDGKWTYVVSGPTGGAYKVRAIGAKCNC